MSVENKIIKILIALIIIFIISVITYESITSYFIPESKYKNASTLFEEEKYEEAISAFDEIKEYKDSTEKIEKSNSRIQEKKLDELRKYIGAYRHVEYKVNPVFNEEEPYGDTLQITNLSASDVRISFDSYNGSRVAGFTSTAKLNGEKYTFTFTDSWYNTGKGTLAFEGDVIKLNIEITKFDEGANFAVNEGDMEFILSEKTQLDT
ncbi:MAG: hypothetical protein IKF17_04750 [Clostridia bacterium]|nr:hypothetical protein [Clostridia bacterium]